MARGDGRVYTQPASPYFWAGYYHNGKECREIARYLKGKNRGTKILARTENHEAAEEFRDARVRRVKEEKDGGRSFIGPQQEPVTVNEVLDDLIIHYKRGGKKAIPREVSPQMESHLKRIRDYCGTMKAVNVGTKHIEEFISQLKAEGKANATVNRSLQLLSQAYRCAVKSDPPKLRVLAIPKLDESDNVRKGKYTPQEAELVFTSLPLYMVDVARYAYETGSRSSEIRQLRWTYLNADAIHIPAHITKTKKPRIISLTPELSEIIERRKQARIPGCDLIFHHDGKPIVDYRKCWHTACVMSGLGAFYCRICRDGEGKYISILDAKKTCPRCGRHWEGPKYIGRLFHDFRRSAAHELRKAGNSEEECMAITGHETSAMFKRYADLFPGEERKAQQRTAQQRRREWKEALAAKVIAMPKAAVQ